jgi:hypothetical protein
VIGDLLLAGVGLLALMTVAFAVKSYRETRQRFYDDYVDRKRK